MIRPTHVLVVAFGFAIAFSGIVATQESSKTPRPVPVDMDGFSEVTIAQEAEGHYSLTSGETRADIFLTRTRLLYKVTKPGHWMQQEAEVERLNTENARITRMGDGWSIHILCRQPDRRIMVCTNFERDGWERPQEVGGLAIGGATDSIDIRLSRQTAEELLSLLQLHFE